MTGNNVKTARLPTLATQPGASPRPANSQPPEKTGIAIADKNPVVRAGLSDFISRDSRFSVSGTVDGGNAFLAVCESMPAPDIGVVAWTLPDMLGSDLLAAIKRRNLKTRVIIYTNDASQVAIRAAAKAGAWGFVSKNDDPALLLDTISLVSRGRLCLPFVDIERLVEDPLDALTTRERQLLAALSKGLTNEQIAARIGISRNTVKYHLKNVYDKLGVKNRAMAVALFTRIQSSEG